MKKISLANVKNALKRDEMRVIAGGCSSGGSTCYCGGCGSCNQSCKTDYLPGGVTIKYCA